MRNQKLIPLNVVSAYESFGWGLPRHISAGHSDLTLIAIRTAAGEIGIQRYRRFFHFAKSNPNHKRNTMGVYILYYTKRRYGHLVTGYRCIRIGVFLKYYFAATMII